MRFVGIDPGVSGAVAIMRDSAFFIEGASAAELVDLPTVTIIVGKRNRTVLDQRATWSILHGCASDTTHFILEAPVIGPAMRGRGNEGDGSEIAGQSVVSLAGTFLLNGQLQAFLTILAVQRQSSFEIVNPQTWKRAMMPGEARDKEAARLRAIQLFPSVAEDLKRKKDHNRAEALLLAEWGRRRMHE